MDGHSYMTNGYSNYHDVPPQESGYVYGPNRQVNWYMVETTTVERFCVPHNEYNNFDDVYNNFGGAPLRNDYRKEYMPKYAPRSPHEVYDLNYGSDIANESPPRYHERENLMDSFLNKLQIGASQPTKTNNLLGPNKYRPTSPNKYRPKSPTPTHSYPSREPHFIQAQYLPAPNRYRPISSTKYQPASPPQYRPISPIKYRPTSPTKYRPISPIKYRPTSPTKHRPTSPIKYRPTSPTKYRQISPIKYRPTSPTTYRPISPTKYRPTIPTKYRPISPTKYHTTNPNNYRPTSPTKFQPTSPDKHPPISTTKHYETNPPKYQPTSLAKFQQTNPTKYQPSSPKHNYPSKENHLVTEQNLSDPNKNQLTSPFHNIPSKEIQPIRTQIIADPNKFHPSSPRPDDDRNVDEFSGPDNNWQNASPPVPHKPLSTPTNDINEALGFLTESASNSPRTQPVKSENRFGWNALGASARRFMRSDMIDSKEAIKKYNGANVP